ncbi:FemAB family XrtA/PEP-CTERM system-associated protein [Parasphingopyxis sp.]|uniref:FemAB family XrtA/PEP-CTERM system-associated protein n=1 Tax=Parasphingopyxis sp. TaxID=1920299 RepID=UPI00261BA1DF|nr:FemAB family XrtA/PEP-CTERM system-associated protein [Parasphingopyxis sp.]
MSLHKLSVRTADLNDPAECARIESYVRETEGGTPFHLPKWLKAVEQGCGQKAHMLLGERAGTLRGILPLTEMHSPLFGRALVSSGFAVGGGALVSNPNNANALADAAWQMAERLSCPEVELRGGALPKGWAKREGVYVGFEKPLAEDKEADLKAVPRKLRAEIRKGLKNDLEIVSGTAERDRADHYAVYATSVRNLGTPVFPRGLFDAMLDHFGDGADILTVRHKDKAISSVLSFYFEGTVMPFWGGGVFEARHLRANDVLYYALIDHARQRGCTRFDFGRSKVKTGPYNHKKNWGFTPEPLTYAGRVADGAEAREMNPNSPKYRLQVSLWQKLPLPIANRIGPWIARGLG